MPPSAPTIPMRRTNPSPPQPATAKPLQLEDIPSAQGSRIVLYGPGGVGKTSLATAAPGPVAFFDLDESLGILRSQLPEDVQKQIKCVPVQSFQQIRDALNSPILSSVRTIVIDSATKAEELAGEWVLQNVPHEKGNKITRLSDYGWGKEFDHIYNAFNLMLGDLDNHARAGRNVILICHVCTNNTPNPAGDDWLRYEPRLQAPRSGKSSIRDRVVEWSDHTLFVGYDVNVKDGKASANSSQTRTIYPIEMAHCRAKSRTLDSAVIYDRGSAELWERLAVQ